MSLKKLVFATFGSVFFITQVSAQVYGSKNQWEFEQLNGLQRVLWQHKLPITPFMENTTEQSALLGLNYLRTLSPNIQFVFGLAYGGQTSTLKTFDFNIVNQFNKRIPFRMISFDPIIQLKMGLKFSQKVNDRTYFSVACNYGLHWGNSTKWTYRLNSNGDSFGLRGYGVSDLNPIGFLQFVPEYQFVLKNFDVISVKLGIQLFNESHIQGIYYSGEYDPYPLFYNSYQSQRGHFQFGLGYTFSRVRKLEKIQALKELEGAPKNVRQLLRSERRTHGEKASYFGIQIGAGLPKLNISDPYSDLSDHSEASFILRANYERGIRNGFFVEAGYHFMEYLLAYSFSNSGFSLRSSSNQYFTHQLSGGGGYRLAIRKTPIVNIHAGLSLGTVLGAVYFYDDPQQYNYGNQVLNISKESQLKSRVFGGAYIGLSRDIHLTNRFMLTLNYRYQQGFTTISEHKFTHSGTAYVGNYETVGKFQGTESTYTIGLKYKISNGK